ncbi:phosphate regulon sensor histidine kinase PhoR [Aquabacterium sp. A7-Y]|uniref:phosphate regulon sensor histidine kinase PhoR n=1 Tax=Aquabacterium sp. A7-Y TaxID=1349605 RepID=UPI00223D60EA|nr:phosphate regulon sensor histidine kinase PhoR [Aquabacterium sp. A7-Y]MCW7540795.1 phosphate regulon sensor histidine kinase PhoR [Aquabacterium sp. A7-Y]
MSWFLQRVFLHVVMMVVGGVAGRIAGAPLGFAAAGMMLGAALGVGLVVLVDALRGRRLLNWLRGSQHEPAPRDSGFWGELGYRIERAVRSREMALVQEKARLAQFLSGIEASPNGVMLLDANDQIAWCNRLAAEHFGLDPVRDLSQHLTNLVRAPGFVSYLREGQFTQPVVFPSPGGRGMVSVILRTYGDGMKLLLSQDITERERAETMRRDFVANVSHEIRTPLTVLSGFIETLVNLPLTEVERKRVLSLMAQQTERMQTLVSDLLTLAQLEGSPRPPSDRWVDVAKLMQLAESDARTLSPGRHQLSFEADGPAQLAGAESELLSALTNLVSNAIRYTPEGGAISVRWQARSNGSGEFIVKDSGIGVEKEHIPRLTERFYRVDGSRSRDTGGTGLGLSIVKHVLQRHGGELDVQSEPGKGSEFRLIFPSLRVRPLVPSDEAQSRPGR